MMSQTRSSVRLILGATAAAMLMAAGVAQAVAAMKVDPATSELEFTAVGKPGFLRINGKGAKITGDSKADGAGLAGTFETKLDEFVTGIDLRDEHMKKKYLETDKYPTAVLHWTTPKAGQASEEVPFKGKLKLHGIEHDVEGTAKLEPSSDKKQVAVDATFPIKLSDYKIDIPTYLGVTVAEDVTVHAKFNAAGG